jgi:hypothetical protein
VCRIQLWAVRFCETFASEKLVPVIREMLIHDFRELTGKHNANLYAKFPIP